MGILNVTPDSFSDGGSYHETTAAVRYGLEMVDQGADIVDVGGESTRPNAGRVPQEVELRRVVPVIRELAACGVHVSIDTMRARVAEAAVAAGAVMINDVSGGLADPAMGRVAAALDAIFIAMHWRAHSAVMAHRATYDDVVADVSNELAQRIEALLADGVPEERLIIDPGLGFAKSAHHNWQLLTNLDRLQALGRPILIEASRKSFLGQLVQRQGHQPPPHDRDDLTCAVSALVAAAGVWGIRAHNVVATHRAVAVAEAFTSAAGRAPLASPPMGLKHPRSHRV
jgi:dihydropteroate synthase